MSPRPQVYTIPILRPDLMYVNRTYLGGSTASDCDNLISVCEAAQAMIIFAGGLDKFLGFSEQEGFNGYGSAVLLWPSQHS